MALYPWLSHWCSISMNSGFARTIGLYLKRVGENLNFWRYGLTTKNEFMPSPKSPRARHLGITCRALQPTVKAMEKTIFFEINQMFFTFCSVGTLWRRFREIWFQIDIDIYCYKVWKISKYWCWGSQISTTNIYFYIEFHLAIYYNKLDKINEMTKPPRLD